MIYERIIGTVFRLDTDEKLVLIDGEDYNYASDAESTLMTAIENDLLVSALLYCGQTVGDCRILRAQIIEEDQEDDDAPTDHKVGED
jgi:hypothetical protein